MVDAEPGKNFEVVYGQIVARTWSDPAFKLRFQGNPREVLAEYGIELPADAVLTVVSDEPNVRNVVLNREPRVASTRLSFQRPRIKSHFRVVVPPGDGQRVFLMAERRHFALTGAAYVALIPLLDGRHGLDVLFEKLADAFTPAQLSFALQQLEKKGFLAESADEVAAVDVRAFWDERDLDPGTAESRLQASQVAVIGVGGADPEPLRAALGQVGSSPSATPELTLVVTSDYLEPGLRDLNEAALRDSRPWMLVKSSGSLLFIGPIFIPGKGACWECLAERLRANRGLEIFLQQALETDQPICGPPGSLPSTVEAACQLAASQALCFLAGSSEANLVDTVVTLDIQRLETERHQVLRLPFCPACGTTSSSQPRPIQLDSSPVQSGEDCGYRQNSPDETYERYRHLVSSVTGVVSKLERSPLLRADSLQVFFGGRNPARSMKSYHSLKQSLRSHSSGKGKTASQARTSALCESLERYSSSFQASDRGRIASYLEVGEEAIPYRSYLHFSDHQYARRTDWVDGKSNFYTHVPRRFDESEKIEWTPVWSLTRSCFRLLPTAYCYVGYPGSKPAFCLPDSNGNAAGNTLAEAILQGFFELVERDCVAMWWYNRLQRPEVDLSSLDDPWMVKIRAEYQKMNRDLWILELTNDLQIPTFAALSRQLGQPSERIIFGFGSHLDRRLAITRAVAELNQFLPMVLQTKSLEKHQFDEPLVLEWWRTARLDNQIYLQPNGKVRAEAAPLELPEDLRDTVDFCRPRVEELGMEMLVLDQTRAEIGMPVVKVIVPGLRHFWSQFGPGRLYDVPVRMGWLDAPTPESELNPIAFFY